MRRGEIKHHIILEAEFRVSQLPSGSVILVTQEPGLERTPNLELMHSWIFSLFLYKGRAGLSIHLCLMKTYYEGFSSQVTDLVYFIWTGFLSSVIKVCHLAHPEKPPLELSIEKTKLDSCKERFHELKLSLDTKALITISSLRRELMFFFHV